jgi:hypothetical protein
MPYECHPGAYWLVLGPDVDLGRTEYDLEAAIERLRAADWPELDDFRKHSFLERLEPDSVSEPFERRAQGTEQSPPP